MVSRLEAALSLAMVALFISVLMGWDSVAAIVGIPFLLLLVAMVMRTGVRKARGASWDDAWGRIGHEAD